MTQTDLKMYEKLTGLTFVIVAVLLSLTILYVLS